MINLLGWILGVQEKPQEHIYAIKGTYPKHVVVKSTDGELICKDNGCTKASDPIARKLYHTVTEVYKFFHRNFGLKGIDRKGEVAPLVIHSSDKNAFWSCAKNNHSCQWTFHDHYAIRPEVVAHEWFHAIVSRLRPLNYQREAGALNESLADVFAVAFKRSYEDKRGSRVRNWKIADLRNLKDPIHMKAFKKLPSGGSPNAENDYGYVHDNSRIPSHAFYKAVHKLDDSINGTILRIWYRAFLKVDPNETFKSFAKKTIKEASRYFDDSVEYAVSKAWDDVGVIRMTSNQKNRLSLDDILFYLL